MQRTDRCSSRSIASTCLLRSCSRARTRVSPVPWRVLLLHPFSPTFSSSLLLPLLPGTMDSSLCVEQRERKRAGSLLYSCAWSCILYPLDGSAAPFVVPIVARRRPSIPTPRPTRFFHYSTPVRTFTPSLRVFGPCPCARHGPVRSLLTLYGEARGMRYLATKVTRILRSLYLMFLSSLY